VTDEYRKGDIRHCFGDISRARALLGYEPAVGLDEGLRDLAAWLEGRVARDGAEKARRELAAWGLTV
jgi:dTDP-L-rhamnose 4-epimerase